MRTHKIAAAISAITITLATGACGNSPSEISLENGADSDNAQAVPETQGPLTEFLNSWGSSNANLSQEEQARRYDERNRRQQELIAQCMADAGFEYHPDLGATTISFVQPDIWRPDDREWVARYGYGIVNDPWRDAEPADAVAEQPLYVDPNADIRAGMSEAENAAWEQALWGAREGDDYDAEPQGCWPWASRETDDDAAILAVATSDEFAPLVQAIQLFFEEHSAWNEITDADRDWANCMADAGYPGFERQFEARNSIQGEQQEFWNAFDWDYWDDAVGGMPSPSDFPELAALGEREIELALADLDCRISADFQARNQAHQIAAETQFFKDYRTQLEALRSALEQAASRS